MITSSVVSYYLFKCSNDNLPVNLMSVNGNRKDVASLQVIEIQNSKKEREPSKNNCCIMALCMLFVYIATIK